MKTLTFLIAALAAPIAPGHAAPRPSFCLPETLYAAPGLECNVYFGSSLDSVRPDLFAFEARARVGKCETARWTWTPSEADGGRRERVELLAWTDAGLACAATVTVAVAKSPADTSRRVTCALLGDSLTNARYQDRVLAALRERGWKNWTPVGSRSGPSYETWGVFRPGEAAHDGYGGFTAESFLTQYAIAVDEIDNLQSEQERQQLRSFGTRIPAGQEWRRGLLKSPLVRFRDGRKELDVQGWLDRVNGGKAPDVLLVELGINGGCSQRDETIGAHVARAKKSLRTLVGEIRRAAPETLIGISTQIVGADQDAFSSYGCAISSVQCHKNMHAVNRGYESLVAELNAAGDRRVRLVPVGQSIDPQFGYIREPRKPFVHSTKPVSRIVNAVHPSLEGGRQMGDAFAAWILFELGEPPEAQKALSVPGARAIASP